MDREPEPLPPGAPRALAPSFVLALVLLFGLGLRSLATLAPDCIAGNDGAYYFVQVRGILRGGGLPFPDFPFLFYALAALARILSFVMDSREAIVAAVRWTDTLLPLVLALPVFFLARDFAREQPSRAALAIGLVGLIAVASGNALVMAAGMIKNGSSLPFSLLYIYFLHRGLRDRELRPALLAALCFLVSSLAHISAMVLNAAFTVMVVLMGSTRRPAWPSIGLLIGLVLAIAFIPVLDADRGGRLLDVIRHPGGIFSRSMEIPGRPEVWLGNALGLLGLYALWRHTAAMESADRLLLGAATLTTLAFSFPFLRPDLLERLALVSFVTGLIPITYLACRDPLGPALVAPITVLVMLHGALAMKTLRVTALVRPAWEDLEGMKGALPPGRNLVMVHPQLRWWTAWALETHFSRTARRALADRDAYDAVLLLEEIRPGAFGLAPTRMSAVPGATLRDGDRLGSEAFTILREGEYFRLSQLRVQENRRGPLDRKALGEVRMALQ